MLRSKSSAWTTLRVGVTPKDERDIATALKLMDGFTMMPLSMWQKHGNQPLPLAQQPTVKEDYRSFQRMDQITDLAKSMLPTDYLQLVSLVINDPSMTKRTDSIKEADVLRHLARLGLREGQTFDPADLTAQQKAAVDEGYRLGRIEARVHKCLLYENLRTLGSVESAISHGRLLADSSHWHSKPEWPLTIHSCFNRTTRAVSLTEEGRRFYEQVMPHLRGMEEAAAAAAGGAATVRRKLRINLDPVFSRIILGPKLDEFMDVHPELELEFIARDQLGDLIMDGFDLALRFREPRSSSLIARKLLDTAIVTVAAPLYLTRRGRPAEPQELGRGEHRCLEFRNPETGKPYPWEFHRKRKKLVVETNGRLTVNDPSALLNACL